MMRVVRFNDAEMASLRRTELGHINDVRDRNAKKQTDPRSKK